MSTDDPYFVKNILNRVKDAYNMSTDAELAEFLEVSTSTVSAWKKRNSTYFKLLFKKCKDLSMEYMLRGEGPMFRDPEDPRNIERKDEAPRANDQGASYNPAELKQQATQFVKMIEHLPLPVEARKEMLQSYLRIVDEELQSLRKSESKDPAVDD